MQTQLRTQADQDALATALVEGYGKPGVTFYQEGKAKFVPVESLNKLSMPQDMIAEVTAQLLMADLKKTTIAITVLNNELQLERISI